jgi:hypothetical protein
MSRNEPRDGIFGHQFRNTRSLLLHAIHNLSNCWILKETIVFSGFKNPDKKIREIRKLESIHEQCFVGVENQGRKPDKNSSQKRIEFMARKLDKNAAQEFPLRILHYNMNVKVSSPNIKRCSYANPNPNLNFNF